MKKLLISILIILLLVLCYFAIANGINFLKIKSINNIKEVSNKLENDFNEANELANKTYPAEVQGLEEAIKQLKISKQEYENKNLYNTEENTLGVIEIKTYKIHYLWTILGNYRKDRGVQSLNLDLKTTENEGVYDLQFTLIGGYTNITDFIYDIENDEELNFEIKNFNISSEITKNNNTQNNATTDNNTNDSTNDSTNDTTNNNNSKNTTNNSTSTTSKSDGITLQAKFTVENIGITLD